MLRFLSDPDTSFSFDQKIETALNLVHVFLHLLSRLQTVQANQYVLILKQSGLAITPWSEGNITPVILEKFGIFHNLLPFVWP